MVARAPDVEAVAEELDVEIAVEVDVEIAVEEFDVEIAV